MAYEQKPKYLRNRTIVIACECGSTRTDTFLREGFPNSYSVRCKSCGREQVLGYPTVHAARKAWLENDDEPFRGGRADCFD